MPLDGAAIAGVLDEIRRRAEDGRVDKVAQPEKDEIILHIRGRGENHKLLLTANASSPRVHFTQLNKLSPQQAPLFCMILRKHLSGGKLLRIVQPDFERIIELHIESPNEMGDRSVKRLIVEIMGKHSNIILTDDRDVILDAARHVSHDTSSVREVLPGKTYVRPPSGGKTDPTRAGAGVLADILSQEDKKGMKIQEAVYKSFNGISPVTASEICLRAHIPPDCFTGALTSEQTQRLYQSFLDLFTKISGGYSACAIYHDANGKPADFTMQPFELYASYEPQPFSSPSEMLEAYYRRRDAEYRLGQKTTDLRKLIQGHTERCVKKRIMQDKTLAEVAGRDRLRVYGELLTAYIYQIEKGAESFTAPNFYDDNNDLDIPLDSALTAAENAQVYFKQYNKQKRTYSALQEQIVKNEEDLAYLDSVSAALQTAFDESDIAEIRKELAEQGFIKKAQAGKASRGQRKSKPLHYISSDGYDIYVGKNNIQNDELTLRFAQNGDIWMHTKDIAGSHVIIKTTPNETPPPATLIEAANLAAYYSKARGSSQTPVDYVIRKHVRKPNGAKPGYVIYDHHKTAFVTPSEPSLEECP